MKGLSLTLTIVIIAIVLLVTALVIMTIFSSQITRIMVVLGIWSDEAMVGSICAQKCSTWCAAHPGSPGTGWDDIGKVQVTQEKTIPCSEDNTKVETCVCTVATIS